MKLTGVWSGNNLDWFLRKDWSIVSLYKIVVIRLDRSRDERSGIRRIGGLREERKSVNFLGLKRIKYSMSHLKK